MRTSARSAHDDRLEASVIMHSWALRQGHAARGRVQDVLRLLSCANMYTTLSTPCT